MEHYIEKQFYFTSIYSFNSILDFKIQFFKCHHLIVFDKVFFFFTFKLKLIRCENSYLRIIHTINEKLVCESKAMKNK